MQVKSYCFCVFARQDNLFKGLIVPSSTPDQWNSSYLRLLQRSIDRLQLIQSTTETILRKIAIPFDVIRLVFNGVLLLVESILSLTGTGLSGNFCSADVFHFRPGHAGDRWHLSVSVCVHTKQFASSLQTRCKLDTLFFHLVGFPFTKANLKRILKLQTKVMCTKLCLVIGQMVRWLETQKNPQFLLQPTSWGIDRLFSFSS